jgi:flagellar assembly protein FliH
MLSEATSLAGTEVLSQPFLYAPIAEGGKQPRDHGDWMPTGSPAGAEVFTKEQLEKRDKDSFERGVREGENRGRVASEARVKALQQTIQDAVVTFQTERKEYFDHIEPEVVQLALAIARKILHREAQIDPLLLTGLVHVALDKLDAGTRVRLRVSPADTHFWNEFFARSTSAVLPELSGDPTLPNGQCVLESDIGSTQISLETQLKEIEQGFFDLLEQRPKVR